MGVLTKQQQWQGLENTCRLCRNCQLSSSRTQVVFGTGNPASPVLIVGEGPGEQEDLQGQPFVGPAGQLLDDMLRLIGLDRTKVYITNVVKCRPPSNRDPLREEQNACQVWLDHQVEFMDPEVILCLGRVAATRMIRPDFKITRDHGKWFRRGKQRLMAIYHPSALLRDEHKRPETFADLRVFRQCLRDFYPEIFEKEPSYDQDP